MSGWKECLCAAPSWHYRATLWCGCLVLLWGLLAGRAGGQAMLVGANFAGSTQSQTGFYPPNSDIAVGYNDVVESINGRFSVRPKVGGTPRSDTTLTGFFNTALGLGGGGSVAGYATDPRIVFDGSSGRWFASARDGGGSSTSPNSLLIAVSTTSDPAGPWRAVQMAGDPAGAAAKDYADYPGLAVGAQGVFLTPNMFSTTNGSYLHGNIVLIPKADLLASTMTLAHSTTKVWGNDSQFQYTYAAQPAGGPAAGAMPELLVTREVISVPPVEGVKLSWITGTASSPIFPSPTTDVNFGVLASTVPAAAQWGSSVKIDTGDQSLSSSVVVVNGDLWGVQTWPTTGSARAQIHWFHIATSNGAILGQGTISDPSLSLYAPSLAVNSSGDIVIGCTGSSSTTYPSAYAIVGSTSGSSSSFGTLTLLAGGTSAYTYQPNASNVVRWGDYSTTVLDPADPGVFWTTQELAVGASNWQTQISQIVPVKAHETRWNGASGGSLLEGSGWLGGAAPGTVDHVIFSVPAAYTVTLTGNSTVSELSCRQGTPTLDLGTYQITLTAAGPATALNIGEFGATPAVTIKNGVLAAPSATLAASGNATAALTLDHATLNVSGMLNVGGTANSPGGTATVTVPAGSALSVGTVGAAGSGGLYIGAGSLVQITGGSLQVAQSLTIASGVGGGKLDLTNSGMVFHSAAANLAADQSALRALLLTGRDTDPATGAARWDGAGIISSSARLTAGTALGLITGSDFLLWHPGQTFHSQSVSASDLLLGYTYTGDTNFDGMITVDDYMALNLGYLFGLSGWAHGDFNYDGSVDYRDYALVDAAYILHGAPMPQAYIDLHTAWFGEEYTAALAAAVPEPGSLALLASGLAMLWQRRRSAR